ncbi:MAG TPA: cell division protein FtsA, partial [Paludibacteraceae bacterium]|nr:cell division protein FtsA [Paludibacteraceae bacterium]
MDFEIIVAADLGNAKLAMMAAKKFADGKLEILALESEPTPLDSIRNGIITKPSEVAARLSMMLKLLGNRIKSPICRFYVGINGRSLRTVRVNIPRIFGHDEEITEEILSDMETEAKNTTISEREILRVLTDTFMLDNEPIQNPIGVIGGNLTASYVLAVGKPEVSLNIDKCADRILGTEIAQKFLAPMATATALLSEAEKELGSAVIDFGAGCTSVAVYKDGLMKHLAVIPIGGKHITNDLKSLKLLDQEAEKLKLMCGDKFSIRDKKILKIELPATAEGLEQRSVSTKDVEHIITARLHEIIDLVMAQIQKSGYTNVLNAGLVITGGVTNMKYVDDIVREKTGMDVRIGSYVAHLT